MSSEKQSETDDKGFGDAIDWIIGQIIDLNKHFEDPVVTRQDFIKAFPKMTETWVRNHWPNAVTAAYTVLGKLNWSVERGKDPSNPFIRARKDLTVDLRLCNDCFNLEEKSNEKRRIGELIAIYLACRDQHFALAGGTTSYFVGLRLAELGELDSKSVPREVTTTNIAIAAHWGTLCSKDSTRKPPFRKLRIPGGVFNLDLFRYQGTVAFAPIGISVVGADASYVHDDQALLYGKTNEATETTNSLLAVTADTIIAAITADKLEPSDRVNPSLPLDFTKSRCRSRFLVSDRLPSEEKSEIVERLRSQQWNVVTRLQDWKRVDYRGEIEAFLNSRAENDPIHKWETVKEYRKFLSKPKKRE